jgi:deoxyribodipyrimidine photo-lyase
MTAAEQQRTACLIGRDYPLPIVDHAVQRMLALALFKQASQPALK